MIAPVRGQSFEDLDVLETLALDPPYGITAHTDEAAREIRKLTSLSNTTVKTGVREGVFIPFVLPVKSRSSLPLDGIRERVRTLHGNAAEEGVVVSAASEQDLWSFLRDFDAALAPMVTLRPEGNFRILWENDAGEQIGLQFLGHDAINYVLFSKLASGELGQHYGVADSAFIRALVATLGLRGW